MVGVESNNKRLPALVQVLELVLVLGLVLLMQQANQAPPNDLSGAGAIGVWLLVHRV